MQSFVWNYEKGKTFSVYQIAYGTLYGYRKDVYKRQEMMVSPITDKLDPVTGLAGAKTWIPQGIWYDFFNGRAYKGGRKVDLDVYKRQARNCARRESFSSSSC